MIRSIFAVLFAFFAISNVASATVTYNYTGNVENIGSTDIGDRLNIQFTVTQTLASNFTGSVSIISGDLTNNIQNSFTHDDPIRTLSVSTDANGQIQYWSIGNASKFSDSTLFSINDPHNLFNDATDIAGSGCANVCDFVYDRTGSDTCRGIILNNSVCSGREIFNSNAAGVWTSDAPASATPEPATWSLVIIGVGGMGAALRTRRRKVVT